MVTVLAIFIPYETFDKCMYNALKKQQKTLNRHVFKSLLRDRVKILELVPHSMRHGMKAF